MERLGGGSSSETKIMYYLDEDDTPYSAKLPIPPEEITLKDLKSIISLPNGNNNKLNSFKYFFKTEDEDLKMTVKELVKDDDAKLPNWRGRVIAYIVTAEGSTVSTGSSSQVTEVSGINNHHHHRAHNHHNNRTGTGGGSAPLRSHTTGFRGHLNNHGSYRNYDDESTTCTEETDSFVSSRCPRHRYHRDCGCDSVSSILTSDMDSTSFVDSDDSDDDSDEDESASRISTTTADTSVSRIQESRYRRRQQRRRRRVGRLPAMSDTSSLSSVTDSTMSMNVITVTLALDAVSFLGISLVGQEGKGIFVGNIMEGGAVALDGRIDPGDMILQVNDKNLENMSNDEAVKILREATSTPGSIRLVILKTWDHNRDRSFTIPRSEPVRPIDPGAWVAHTEAARAAGEYPMRPPSASTMSSNGSSSHGGSCVTDSERLLGMDHDKILLSLDMEMMTIAKSMAAFDSGLDVREREWLKLKIPNAFYGSDVVDWLYNHVQGFNERREAKKYASDMLKAGLLKHIYKKGFSEQSFYTFGEEILVCMEGINRMRLESDQEHQSVGYHFLGSLHHRTSSSGHSSSDGDTLLLAPGRENGRKHGHPSSPLHSNHATESAAYTDAMGVRDESVASSSSRGGRVNGFLPWGSDAVHYGIFGGNPVVAAAAAGGGVSGNNTSSESDQRSQLSGPLPSGVSSFKNFQPSQLSSFASATNGLSMSPAHVNLLPPHQQTSSSLQYQPQQHHYAEPSYPLSAINSNGASNGIPEVSPVGNKISSVMSPSSSTVGDNNITANGRLTLPEKSTSIGINL